MTRRDDLPENHLPPLYGTMGHRILLIEHHTASFGDVRTVSEFGPADMTEAFTPEERALLARGGRVDRDETRFTDLLAFHDAMRRAVPAPVPSFLRSTKPVCTSKEPQHDR